jgi:hypothetical protein
MRIERRSDHDAAFHQTRQPPATCFRVLADQTETHAVANDQQRLARFSDAIRELEQALPQFGQ